ncbi:MULTISPECIES: phosphate-starvation-inducible PsiE family protein [Rhodomicrobium]|uniref:phosphate-starvation-inducible PsiE family protein n=1 Tax=Rhodomicrobium TaxID=1068 RepID=UPI000B4A863F|nr:MULTISPECIES: phosphate-starvation-inducible PsiE family protein [Rhodomicrobium]
MTVRSEIRAAKEQWQALTFYEKFEQAVVLILTALIAIIVVAAVWNLALNILFVLIFSGPRDPGDNSVFQALFGMIFTVIIGLEFKRSLLVIAERRDSIVQVRTVVLLAMLAILRKLIILDLSSAEAGKIFALSAAMLSLGVVYWLVRDQDRRVAAVRRREPAR